MLEKARLGCYNVVMTKFKMIKEKLLSFFKSEKEEVPFKNHISQENDNDYLADDLSDFETENTEEQAGLRQPTDVSKGYHEKAKKQEPALAAKAFVVLCRQLENRS